MKTNFYRRLISLLGFATVCSCSQTDEYGCPIPDPPPMPEYGPAPIETYEIFSVKGKVVDTDGNPIPYISVTTRGGEHTATDTEGDFAFERVIEVRPEGNPHTLHFADVDGPANGSFEEATVVLTLHEETSTPEAGDFVAEEVTVTLKRTTE